MSRECQVDVGIWQNLIAPMRRIVAEEYGKAIVGFVLLASRRKPARLDIVESLAKVAIDRERWFANILDTDDEDAVVAAFQPTALIVEQLPASFALNHAQ